MSIVKSVDGTSCVGRITPPTRVAFWFQPALHLVSRVVDSVRYARLARLIWTTTNTYMGFSTEFVRRNAGQEIDLVTRLVTSHISSEDLNPLRPHPNLVILRQSCSALGPTPSRPVPWSYTLCFYRLFRPILWLSSDPDFLFSTRFDTLHIMTPVVGMI